jgi:hypothetical protein
MQDITESDWTRLENDITYELNDVCVCVCARVCDNKKGKYVPIFPQPRSDTSRVALLE